MTKVLAVLLLAGLVSCAQSPKSRVIPERLPMAVANNAVAYLNVHGMDKFYTFNGLLPGKTHTDITNAAYVWQSGRWQQFKTPTAQLPVLASIAVSVAGSVYLFGGYTVAADHSEKSIPNVWRIDGVSGQWYELPSMPTPVDDTVALVYQNRYIYLISGWHDVDNVDLVQVFDTQNKTWQSGSAFPLPPVFGHAGAIIGNQMLVCDGVKVVKVDDKKQFLSSPACAMGRIDPNQPASIDWQPIKHHSGTAFYRMAAASGGGGQYIFAAGSDNPYNYDGIGYNKVPSNPSSDVRVYDLNLKQWVIKRNEIPATMDHRALLNTPHGLVIMGGMGEDQQVLDQITYYQN